MAPGEFYHLFNHANGWENVFIEEKNYSYFLRKLTHHELPVCRIRLLFNEKSFSSFATSEAGV